jgi:hypothetical protein
MRRFNTGPRKPYYCIRNDEASGGGFLKNLGESKNRRWAAAVGRCAV